MDGKKVDTGGGAFVEGDVSTGGDFVGRDKVTYHIAGNAVIEKLPVYVGVPSLPNYFVGREALVEKLGTRLLSGEHPALSADGLPGVGKTALAINLARQHDILQHFKDGVLWAGLGPQPDVMSILARWARALEIDVSNLVTPEERAQVVQDTIAQRHILLVIDDAWDLKSAQLLHCGGPNCSYVLTTRNQAIARGFAGTTHVENVPVLEEDSTVQLLKLLAPEAYAANPNASRTLVNAVGGLPLAVELLGGYLAIPEHSYFPELSQEALEEMADPQQRLQLAQKRLGAHQEPEVSLQETILLSLNGLPSQAVDTFHALGAFAPEPDQFERVAAEAVTGADARTLALLIARNLVQQSDTDWLSLHQTIADVAREEVSLRFRFQERHRDFYLSNVLWDKTNWRYIEQIYGQVKWAWSRQVEQDPESMSLPDFFKALDTYQKRRGLWTDSLNWAKHGLKLARAKKLHQTIAALTTYIGQIFSTLGEMQQALDYYNQALPLVQRLDDIKGQASILHGIGWVYSVLGDQQQALDYYNQALSLFQQLDDIEGQASVLNDTGLVYNGLGDKQQALHFFNQTLPLFQRCGNKEGEATTLANIGFVYADLGNQKQALYFFDQVLPFFQQLGHIFSEASTLHGIGKVYWSLGEIQQAFDYYNRSLFLSRQVGNIILETATLNDIGLVYSVQGDQQQALQFHNQALTLSQQVGNKPDEATALNNIGEVYRSLGDMQQALDFYKRALSLERQVGDISGEAATLNNIGLAYEALGDKQRALNFYRRVIPLRKRVGDLAGESVTRYNMANIYLSMNKIEEAEKLMLQVVALDEACNHPDLESDKAYLVMIQVLLNNK